jgi:hypothetical protein
MMLQQAEEFGRAKGLGQKIIRAGILPRLRSE